MLFFSCFFQIFCFHFPFLNIKLEVFHNYQLLIPKTNFYDFYRYSFENILEDSQFKARFLVFVLKYLFEVELKCGKNGY